MGFGEFKIKGEQATMFGYKSNQLDGTFHSNWGVVNNPDGKEIYETEAFEFGVTAQHGDSGGPIVHFNYVGDNPYKYGPYVGATTVGYARASYEGQYRNFTFGCTAKKIINYFNGSYIP